MNQKLAAALALLVSLVASGVALVALRTEDPHAAAPVAGFGFGEELAMRLGSLEARVEELEAQMRRAERTQELARPVEPSSAAAGDPRRSSARARAH